jgi:hypothetical protein
MNAACRDILRGEVWVKPGKALERLGPREQARQKAVAPRTEAYMGCNESITLFNPLFESSEC